MCPHFNQAEKDFCQKVFSKKNAIAILQASTAPILDAFAEASEALLNRFKKNVVARKDYSSADPAYIMLDILDALQPLLKEYDGTLAVTHTPRLKNV